MAVLIDDIKARQIIDSRANPTLEARIILNNGIEVFASVPSGASVGTTEAVELRDNNPDYLFSKSVLKAVKNVENIIAPELKGLSPFNQGLIDDKLQKLDNTDNFSNLGANAALAVSIGVCLAASRALNLEPYRYLGGISANTLPIPMINVINGGVHSDNLLDFQEFMIVPIGAKSFSEAMKMSLEVFYHLKNILKKKGFSVNVGDEGGFAPQINNAKAALEILVEAIENAGYSTDEIKLALDVAAGELYENGKYNLKGENKILSSCEMIEYLSALVREFPIISVEDGLSDSDFEYWKSFTFDLGKKSLLVGDDLFTTNPKLLKNGINNKVANAILIKPNQIGTVTKTIEAIQIAKRACYKTIASHRSGETESTFIADLAVGLNTGFIKTGSLTRVDRTAKYNRLLYIEELLGKNARFGSNYI